MFLNPMSEEESIQIVLAHVKQQKKNAIVASVFCLLAGTVTIAMLVFSSGGAPIYLLYSCMFFPAGVVFIVRFRRLKEITEDLAGKRNSEISRRKGS